MRYFWTVKLMMQKNLPYNTLKVAAALIIFKKILKMHELFELFSILRNMHFQVFLKNECCAYF